MTGNSETLMRCQTEWITAVGNALGPNSSGDPLRNHGKHTCESSLERMEEGYLLVEGSPSGGFPPSIPPPNTHTHTSESHLPTLDQAPKMPAGKSRKDSYSCRVKEVRKRKANILY